MEIRQRFREMAEAAVFTRPNPEGLVQAFAAPPVLDRRAVVEVARMPVQPGLVGRLEIAALESSAGALALRSYLQTLGYRSDVDDARQLGLVLAPLQGRRVRATVVLHPDGLSVVANGDRVSLRELAIDGALDCPCWVIASALSTAAERLARGGHATLLRSARGGLRELRIRRQLGALGPFRPAGVGRARRGIVAA